MDMKCYLGIALLALLVGCASLPADYERERSWRLDTSDTLLARALAPLIAAHPGKSGAYPLQDGVEALAARMTLVRSAEKTLDVQYYIWHSDAAGTLLVKELLDAADRGVRVRLLLDDLGLAARNDDYLLLLAAHPNVQVHLYNPIASRGARTLGLVSDPVRLNHRMHNKSLTADNMITIVGGRNIGDEYFSLNQTINFADLDILAVGQVAVEVVDSFDAYWNSDATIPVQAFHGQLPGFEQQAAARRRLDALVAARGAPYYQAMRASQLTESVKEGSLEYYWGEIVPLYDAPDKHNRDDGSALLLQQVKNLVGETERELVIVSPYFVPGKTGTRVLVAAARQGVRVRVYTNSLAATDVPAVHAGYRKYREDLLDGGVEVYELKPLPGELADENLGSSFAGSSTGASLHAKLYFFDRQQVFVGSMNLDPRSVEINTEIGLLIKSPPLTQALLADLPEGPSEGWYSLVLEPRDASNPEGRTRLVWLTTEGGEPLRYTSEPLTTFWQRLGVGFIGLFPVESQL